jgi:hypothetical protein
VQPHCVRPEFRWAEADALRTRQTGQPEMRPQDDNSEKRHCTDYACGEDTRKTAGQLFGCTVLATRSHLGHISLDCGRGSKVENRRNDKSKPHCVGDRAGSAHPERAGYDDPADEPSKRKECARKRPKQ